MKPTYFLRLVLVKVWFNLRTEAAQHRLSYTWWVLEHVLHMGAFYVVFKILLQRGTDDFVAFLLCGLVPCPCRTGSSEDAAAAEVDAKRA